MNQAPHSKTLKKTRLSRTTRSTPQRNPWIIDKAPQPKAIQQTTFTGDGDFDAETNRLMGRVNVAVEMTSGCGNRGQIYVNTAMGELNQECEFVGHGFRTLLP